MSQLKYYNKKGLKLHLGCGQVRLDGFVNIDRDPNAAADLFLDALDLDQEFSPGSISEIQMYHIINYLTLWDARTFFVKIFKLLEPNGKICIETVNAYKCMEMAQKNADYFPEYLEGMRAFHAFGNDHLEDQLTYYPNSFSWTPWHLKAELELAGFTKTSILAPQSHSPERDMRLEAIRLPNSTLDKINMDQNKSNLDNYKPKVLFIYDSNLGHATLQVRGLMHKEMFHKNGWTVDFLDYRNFTENQLLEIAKSFDVVYLLKVASLALTKALKRESKVRTVFDLTDSLWIPFHQAHGWHDLDAILKDIDYIFSENEFVCAYGRKYKPVFSIPVATHPKEFDAARELMKPKNENKVVVGWLGSSGTTQSLIAIKDQLIELCERNPEVELRIVGSSDESIKEHFPACNISMRGGYNHHEMIEEIISFDIGLYPAPLDIEDYIIRGAQKAMLYMQGEVPPVALNLGECATVIEEGVTGMLVNQQSDWLSKTEILVRNPELRKQIGKNASKFIRIDHSNEQVFETLVEGIYKVYNEIKVS